MMLKQLLFSAAVASVAISASAESKVLWQSEDPAGKLVGWGDPALTLTAEEAASIKAGDFLTMTVEGVDPENGWPQVALFQGNVGWPPAVNEGVGNKEYPYVASFGVTPEFADSIHAYGIVFKGDGAYVSAVGLKEGTINVGPNTVWFGPKQCNWGDAISISKSVFEDVAAGDKIVVEYDKSVEEHTLQFIFGGWSGANIASYEAWKAPFLKNDEEAGTYTITLNSSLSDLTWGPEGEEKQYDLFALLKEGGLIMQGPCLVNQVLYITLADINKAAYDEVIAQLDELQAKYDAAVKEIKETNPNFDFTEWDEIIPAQIESAKQYAEMALNSANEEGEPFSNYFYGGTEEIEYTLSSMLMTADPAPEFPSTFNVTLSNNEGVELTTDDSWGVFTINVAGKSTEEELTITVAVPEGFDGFVSMRDLDYNPGIGGEPLSTRADEPEWTPLSMLLEDGCKEGNTMTFPVDGVLHSGTFMLYKHGLVDINNQINVEFEVEYDLVAANQAAYDEVVAKIEALQKDYEVALKEAEEANPDYDFSEWKEIIGGALDQALEGAKQALESANEDGEVFQFAFDGEEFEVMIAEMKKYPTMEANQAAYDEVVAKIEALQKEYEVALKEAEEANPDYDFSEWKEIIAGALDQALEGAEQELFSANEDGEAFQFAFDGEEFEVMIAEMKKAPIVSENYDAYDKVMAEINEVKAEYEKAVSEIETEYPEFDMTEMKEIIENAISEAETGAEQALDAANEEGEAYFYPFSTEEIENMIAQMKEDAATSGVNGVNAADKAIYYDLDGNKINNPKAGMYVKIVDGKATKVVVK